jgi:hypothetical protein
MLSDILISGLNALSAYDGVIRMPLVGNGIYGTGDKMSDTKCHQQSSPKPLELLDEDAKNVRHTNRCILMGQFLCPQIYFIHIYIIGTHSTIHAFGHRGSKKDG